MAYDRQHDNSRTLQYSCNVRLSPVTDIEFKVGGQHRDAGGVEIEMPEASRGVGVPLPIDGGSGENGVLWCILWNIFVRILSFYCGFRCKFTKHS